MGNVATGAAAMLRDRNGIHDKQGSLHHPLAGGGVFLVGRIAGRILAKREGTGKGDFSYRGAC